MSSTTNDLAIADDWPRSSTAFTSKRHFPGAGAPPVGGNATGYVPGSCEAVEVRGAAPAGARNVTVTEEGRTIR